MAAAAASSSGASAPDSALGWSWEEAQAFLLSGPELPRYDIDDPSVLANIRNKMPMIITGSLLIEPVRRRWTLDYLAKHSKDVSYSVKMSSGHFRAADHESNDAGFDHADMIRTSTMTMPQFFKTMQAHCARDGGRIPFAGSSEEPSKIDPHTATKSLVEAGLAPSRSEWRSRNLFRKLQARSHARQNAKLATEVTSRASKAPPSPAPAADTPSGVRLTELDALLQTGCDALGTAASIAGQTLRDAAETVRVFQPPPQDTNVDAAVLVAIDAATKAAEADIAAAKVAAVEAAEADIAAAKAAAAKAVAAKVAAPEAVAAKVAAAEAMAARVVAVKVAAAEAVAAEAATASVAAARVAATRVAASGSGQGGDDAGGGASTTDRDYTLPRALRRALQRLHSNIAMPGAISGHAPALASRPVQTLAARRDKDAVAYLWRHAGGEGPIVPPERSTVLMPPQPEPLASAAGDASGTAAHIPNTTGDTDGPWHGLPVGRSGGNPLERVYLQQALCDGVGQPMIRDFRGLSWSTVSKLQLEGKWGPLTTNLLLIAQRGAVTPLHYDEQHNLLCQARGRKLVVMGAPQDWTCFYPFPVGHPCDKQAQVYPRDPDVHRFPRWREATLHHAVLQPGEVLYIPAYWWHHIESPWEDTLSVNFWHRCSPATPDLSQALSSRSPERLVLCRNMERLLSRALGACRAVDLLLRLQRGMTLSAAETRAHADALSLLGKLLRPAEADKFLAQLVDARFDLPRRAATITTYHLALTQRAALCGIVAGSLDLDTDTDPVRRHVARGDIASIARLVGWRDPAFLKAAAAPAPASRPSD